MDDPFSRSRQALVRDTPLRALGWAAGTIGLLGVWTTWLFFACVGVYSVSESARLEVVGAAQPVDTLVDGRLVAVRVALGDEVEAGDVLFEVEAEGEQLGVAGAESQLRGLERQHDQLALELARERDAWTGERAAAQAKSTAAAARLREAEEVATHAEEQAARVVDLHARSLVSEVQLSDARTQARQKRAAADTAQAEARQLVSEADVEGQSRRAHLAELERERARLEGEIEQTRRAIQRGVFEVTQRLVTAPSAGSIAALADLGPGAVVAAGDRLATIVPAGDLRVVAYFAPAQALGRIQRGQLGRMRLEGFSWTHYGTLVTRVARVAAEPREGRIRVELDLVLDEDTRAPIAHGLVGSLEIEVERVSPAVLALRAAGHKLGAAAPRKLAAGGA
jgi:membrane fusion protein (multidrug efflux system)